MANVSPVWIAPVGSFGSNAGCWCSKTYFASAHFGCSLATGFCVNSSSRHPRAYGLATSTVNAPCVPPMIASYCPRPAFRLIAMRSTWRVFRRPMR